MKGTDLDDMGIREMEPGDSFIDEITGIRVKIPRGGKITGTNLTSIDFAAPGSNLIAGIEVTFSSLGEETEFSYGWTKTEEGKLKWSGDPTQVVTLSSATDDDFASKITQIEFTVVAGYALTVGESDHGTVTFKVHDNEVTAANEGDKIMMEITPDEGWGIEGIQGLWFDAQEMETRSVANVNIELTPVSGNPNAFTFTMKGADAKFVVNYSKLTGIDSVQTDGEDDEWFDLNGQRLSGRPTQQGVYIYNGRKVVIP